MPACSEADTLLFATFPLPVCPEEEEAVIDLYQWRGGPKQGLTWGDTQLLQLEPALNREEKVKELDGSSVLKLPNIF